MQDVLESGPGHPDPAAESRKLDKVYSALVPRQRVLRIASSEQHVRLPPLVRQSASLPRAGC